MQAIISYTLWRLGFFFVPFLIMAWAGVPIWLAAAIALVFAFCASYLFLQRQRTAFVEALGRARRGERTVSEDEDIEDAVVDADPTPAPEASSDADADEERDEDDDQREATRS